MSVSRSFSSRARVRDLQWRKPFWLCFALKRWGWIYMFTYLLIASTLLVSCSWLNFGESPIVPATPTPSEATLAKLHWCGKPLMIFRDEGAAGTVTPSVATTPTVTGTATITGSPTTITDWTQVEPYLGFTVYLPPTLPPASCLTSASGTIHDPILGGSFTIGYLLPDHSSVSLSEAPLRSENTTFQCILSTTTAAGSSRSATTKEASSTATPGKAGVPMQVCTGARDMTRIVFSARGTMETLQRFFTSLQPHVEWVPAS